MSFDFSTLVTDRTQADVTRVQELASKIRSGTASESELAEFNSAAMKGAYNHTDLNRVTAAMEALKAKLEGYGYAVPGYQRIKVPHVLPEPEPTSRLPEGYTELTYIESTGTQYIDAGFKPNNNTRVVSCFTWLGGGAAAFGTRSGNGYLFFFENGVYQTMFGGSYKSCGTATQSKTTVDMDGASRTVTINGSATSLSNNTFQVSTSLFLLAFNENGSGKLVGSFKLYSCQIYDNGTLVRDFVPCINPSGAVGLYDLVTAAFFGNSGTGTFVAGVIPRKLPEGYTQVEYIQSNGSQWINTNYSPRSENVVYECEWIEPTLSAGTSLFGSTNTTSSANKWSGVHYHNAQGSLYSATGSSDKMCIIDGVAAGSKNSLKTTISNGTITRIQNGKTLTASYSGSIQNGVPIGLFADIRTADVVEKCPVQILLWKMWDNGVIVRDFVPCKNNNGVYGMYDLANDAFYQNAGTGTFAAGEEIVAPATASVMVASGNADEYDPYTWYEFDWPTTETMTVYLLNVSAIRAVLAVLRSTPEVPTDMERLMTRDANDIEAILLDVYRQLTIMPTTFIPCGEALCGGDNL